MLRNEIAQGSALLFDRSLCLCLREEVVQLHADINYVWISGIDNSALAINEIDCWNAGDSESDGGFGLPATIADPVSLRDKRVLNRPRSASKLFWRILTENDSAGMN